MEYSSCWMDKIPIQAASTAADTASVGVRNAVSENMGRKLLPCCQV